MNPQILQILKCPACSNPSNKLVAENTKVKAGRIEQGDIRCPSCNTIYPIINGIPKLLLENNGIRKEMEGNRDFHEKYRKNKSAEWLLNLPEAADFGDEKKGNKDLKVNVEKTLARLESPCGYALDLGAGTCWTTWQIARIGFTAVAVDLAREKYIGLESAEVFIQNKNIYFYRIQADMAHLPFIDSTFNMVFVSTAIHHSRTPKALFKEISRILIPGGKLYTVGEPNRPVWVPQLKIFRFFMQRNQKGSFLWHEGHYSIPEWKKYCINAGLAPKFLIPPHAMDILEGKTVMSNTHKIWKRWIAAVFRNVPQFNKFRNILFYIGLYLAGVSFVMEAEKKQKTWQE
ncbi:MAG: hypothetical protein A2161_22035 [Candidatus Schekmanbacteria bacterium RBG_13_48_7]|uniref:Methyltransferase type 11 domain-containing protein n=1 Tax=Candidatus Schekmanbacteria bacterium RBG_13_48_7 TaxID=1817878 RepID=A0A1F7RY79_9BACT|nr:MAG: hypothetical protein A2161_22035 [Candidatus Schekmanbacteria bacterium RBG_13_48_7]